MLGSLLAPLAAGLEGVHLHEDSENPWLRRAGLLLAVLALIYLVLLLRKS